jgi:hypothetical protein
MHKKQKQYNASFLYSRQDNLAELICESKEKLELDVAQKILARNTKKKARNYYKCKVCSFYHIGSNK